MTAGPAQPMTACTLLTPLLDAGFTYRADAHGLTIEKPAGTSKGQADFASASLGTGDFTVSVVASRASLGNSYLGLAVGQAGGLKDVLLDVFFAGATGPVFSNVFQPGNPGEHDSYEAGYAEDAAVFILTRTSGIIRSYYGAVPTLLAESCSNAGYQAAVTASLFLIVPAGSTDNGPAESGTFTGLAIDSAPVRGFCWAPV